MMAASASDTVSSGFSGYAAFSLVEHAGGVGRVSSNHWAQTSGKPFR